MNLDDPNVGILRQPEVSLLSASRLSVPKMMLFHNATQTLTDSWFISIFCC